jgi:putative ABC transport system permease protein
MKAFKDAFLWRLAWRETRKQRGKLFLYMSSIIIGVAALVSVQSVGKNLNTAISAKSKALLGADLRLQSRRSISPAIDSLFNNKVIATASQTQFMSMVAKKETKATRFSSITGISNNFPLHGELEVKNKTLSPHFFLEKNAIIDESLGIQLDLQEGDSIKIGQLNFRVFAFLKRLPGESIAASFAPRVIVPKQYLAKTGLIQQGSMINYTRLFNFSPSTDVDALIEPVRNTLRKEKYSVTTEKSQQARIQKAFTSLYKFLSLVGYISLILGGIGISSTIFVYLKGKIKNIAIMRSMGAKSRETLTIFAIQSSLLGLIGSCIGVLLGLVIQFALPAILKGFIDLEFTASLSPESIFSGFLIGLLTSIAFTLLPILSIRKISPIQAIRESAMALRVSKKTKLLFSLFIAAFITGITFFQLQHLLLSIGFTLFIAFAFISLFSIATLLMFLVKKTYRLIPHTITRHAFAGLFRPNNQTRTMLISIGLGICLIGMLYFTQDSLLQNVQVGGSGDKANMLMIDIQADQENKFHDFMNDYNIKRLSVLPIVQMKLNAVNGISVDSLKKDTLNRRRRFRSSLRSSYANSLRSSETIVKGRFETRTRSLSDSIFISIEDQYAERLGVSIGDSILFDVQGFPVLTYVGSLRKVDWRRAEPNFLIIFPDGVLNHAPLTFVAVIKAATKDESINIQRDVVAKFPNISVIDLQQMISAIEDIIDKISLIIEFMALFSIITGFIILAGGIISSRYQRMQEHVILRTLGAVKRQLQLLLVLEYSVLGLLASALGLLLSYMASWIISSYWFDIEFLPHVSTSFYIVAITVSTTLLIGLLNSRGITSQSPLEILRRES